MQTFNLTVLFELDRWTGLSHHSCCKKHMNSLSTKMRTGLKVAACLGTIFDERVWEKVKRDNDIEDSFLQSCVDFGFLQALGSDKYIWGTLNFLSCMFSTYFLGRACKAKISCCHSPRSNPTSSILLNPCA
jgi:hypothetical protein